MPGTVKHGEHKYAQDDRRSDETLSVNPADGSQRWLKASLYSLKSIALAGAHENKGR
jgi:hypothetical protein